MQEVPLEAFLRLKCRKEALPSYTTLYTFQFLAIFKTVIVDVDDNCRVFNSVHGL